jgi:putative phosphoesterase
LRLAIIADTHMPKGARELPEACVARLAAADLVIHLGDFSSLAMLRRLERLGPPLAAVHGNVDDADVRRLLPARRVLELEGIAIALVHDAGPRRGRLARLRRRFPDAQAVLFGHSHMPLHERTADGFQIFNPGSPTERRRAPHRTMGIGELAAGRLRLGHLDLA